MDAEQKKKEITGKQVKEAIIKQDDKTKQEIYIHILDSIDAIFANKFTSLMQNIVGSGYEKINILLSSNGGDVMSGIDLYHLLKALPIKIAMYNTGQVDSIATVIFLAGDERYCCKHSSFLFHGVTREFPNGAVMTYHGILEQTSLMEADISKISGIIQDTTSMTEKDLSNRFSRGSTLDAQQALDEGVVHGIKDAVIPRDAIIVNFDLAQILAGNNRS